MSDPNSRQDLDSEEIPTSPSSTGSPYSDDYQSIATTVEKSDVKTLEAIDALEHVSASIDDDISDEEFEATLAQAQQEQDEESDELADEAEAEQRFGTRSGGALSILDDSVQDEGDDASNVAVPASRTPLTPWARVLRRAIGNRTADDSDQLSPATLGWMPGERLIFMIDLDHSSSHLVRLSLGAQRKLSSGKWSAAAQSRLTIGQLLDPPDAADRPIMLQLLGVHALDSMSTEPTVFEFQLRAKTIGTLLPELCKSGRLIVRSRQSKFVNESTPHDCESWNFRWLLRPRGLGRTFALEGRFERGSDTMELDAPLLILEDGWMFTADAICQYHPHEAYPLIRAATELKDQTIARGELKDLLDEVSRGPAGHLLELDAATGYHFAQSDARPQPSVRLLRPKEVSEALTARISFNYGDTQVSAFDGQSLVVHHAEKTLVRRNETAEQQMLKEFQGGGGYMQRASGRCVASVSQKQMPSLVQSLLARGWKVEAQGIRYRKAGTMSVSVASGIDWFDLSLSIDFDGKAVPLPQLLKALRKGQNTVLLDDGSLGLLPEEWLTRHAALAELGSEQEESIRFSRSQLGLLDMLLAESSQVQTDEAFDEARLAFRDFVPEVVTPPDSFIGTLRPYQNEGLNWLTSLQRLRLGGCLADDMGLGKTVQVLALLESRRLASSGPSLVVVPKSLIFNWRQEALRFTPGMRVLDQTGVTRVRDLETLNNFDLILTTYGTLRRDFAYLREAKFDYIVLDEAQAIKNAGTATAKAVRLLRSNFRLALSGTPIENHLRELWSLMEFLNPGMLGRASVFKNLSGAAKLDDPQARQMLSRAVRPVVLRRTKGQVASDLPERSEQTLLCDLEPQQRQMYDELRAHYRKSLLGQLDSSGIDKMRMQVLEALLRLRQAACHPGLVDETQSGAASAKLDLLMEHMGEVLEENHKVLIFSQFTSFLALARQRLDAAGICYEYLDGQTRDRQERVERFQTDTGCQVFLISLKAGGVGLNLTAADYVYLLDPWWNPAVEAQAIDRSHRIGQTRSVFAYRLIARDTVEQKVLQLQSQKRDLANAIISETAEGAGSSLTAEDLKLLLS